MTTNPPSQSKPWWNRPLVGSVSIVERILGAINPQQIPELALSLHDTELEELTRIEPTLRMLDNDQYNSEFLYFMEIRDKIERNLDDYKGLQTFIKILSFGIQNINDFKIINRTETDCRGNSQINLYEFIEEQLTINSDPSFFKQIINDEMEEYIDNIISDSIKEIFINYKNALNNVTHDAIGLNLLAIFKRYKISDYSIFNVINATLKQIKKQDLTNLKALVLVVKVNYDDLDKLGQLIGVPQNDHKIITYAKILQYIALNNRYENIIYRFQQLLDNLNKWYKHYQTIAEIRTEYPNHKYKIPTNFTSKIPGELIYLKYKNFLMSVD